MRAGRELACVLRESFCNHILTSPDLRRQNRLVERAGDAAFHALQFSIEKLEPRWMFSAPAHLDPTFGVNGLAMVPGGITACALASGPNGTIYVAGTTGNATGIDLMRVNADGSPDTTFGNNGIASCDLGFSADGNSILVQPDGKVIVESVRNDTAYDETTSGVLARFNADGSVDTGFGTAGSAQIVCHNNVVAIGLDYTNFEDTQIAATSLAPDGKITVLSKDGTDIQIQRLNADGSPDTTFGPAGQRFYPLQSTANIAGQDVFAGSTPDGGYVVDEIIYSPDIPTFYFVPTKEFRFDSAGDLTSETNVVLPRDVGHADTATLLPDGRVLLYRSGMGIDGADLSSPGSPVLAFGDVHTSPANGYFDINTSLTVAPDGKIYIVGVTPDGDKTGAIQRFNADGSVDQSFSHGQVMGELGSAGLVTVLPLPDGSVIVASQTESQYNGFELFKALPGGPAGLVDTTDILLVPPGQSPGATGSAYSGIFSGTQINVLDPSSARKLFDADPTDA